MPRSENQSQDPTDELTIPLSPTNTDAAVTATDERQYTVSPSDIQKIGHFLATAQAVSGTAAVALISGWGTGGIIAISGLSAAVQELTFRLGSAAIDSKTSEGVKWLSRGSQAAMLSGGVAIAGSLLLAFTGQSEAALTLLPPGVALAHGGIKAHHMLPDDKPQITLRLMDVEDISESKQD